MSVKILSVAVRRSKEIIQVPTQMVEEHGVLRVYDRG